MLLMSLAFAGDYDDWADSVLDEIEERAEEAERAHTDAARAQDELAVRCIASQAGTIENALLRAEQAADRLEAASDDGNSYAIETEVLVLQAELERSRNAAYAVQSCWYVDTSGGGGWNPPSLSMSSPLQLAVGGGWSNDPLMSGSPAASFGGGSIGIPENGFYRYFLSGMGHAKLSAERWPKQESLNHWAALDTQADFVFMPDNRVRLSLSEELFRDPTATTSWLPGPMHQFEHWGRVGIEGGFYRYAFIGVTHRYDRVVLADEERRVQAWGGELEWRWPLYRVTPKGIGRAELLDNDGVGGWGLDGMMSLEMPLTWWLILEGGGGLAVLGYEDLFQPKLGWQAMGQMQLVGSYRNLWLRWERDLADDWLGRGVDERGLTGGFNTWLGSRLYLAGEGQRMRAVDLDTTLLGGEATLGVRVVNGVRVEARGHHHQRSGVAEGKDQGGGLYLVIGG